MRSVHSLRLMRGRRSARWSISAGQGLWRSRGRARQLGETPSRMAMFGFLGTWAMAQAQTIRAQGRAPTVWAAGCREVASGESAVCEGADISMRPPLRPNAWVLMSSDPPEHQVPYAVAELEAAVFKLGERPVVGLDSVAAQFRTGSVDQQRFSRQHLEHLLGIRLPVGGQVQVATGLDVFGQALHKGALDQTALVVAALVPGIRKEDVHTVQAVLAQHVVHDFDRVVLHDADIANVFFAAALEQRAHRCVLLEHRQ